MCLGRSESQLCDLLIKAGAKLDPATKDIQGALLSAVRSQRYREVRQYLQKGVSPNFGDRLYQRPLTAAVLQADAAMVKLLTQYGADANWQDPRMGHSLVFLFARQQLMSASVLQTLLQVGLNLNVTDVSGNTPLFTAAGSANTQVLEVILSAGGGVNAVNKLGWSALMHAARSGRVNNVRALLKAGADPDLRLPVDDVGNQPGQTAYDIAVKSRNFQCAKLLQHAARE